MTKQTLFLVVWESTRRFGLQERTLPLIVRITFNYREDRGRWPGSTANGGALYMMAANEGDGCKQQKT